MVLHLHSYNRISLCVVTQKHVFLIPYIKKKTQKLNNSKNIKKRVGIHYQCHRMLLLVVRACQDLPENLSLHIIDGNYLMSPPWKEISWVGVRHPTSTQSMHHICPTSLDQILNPMRTNVNSRAEPWNTLEEERANYTTETEVLYPAHLAFTELLFHVTQ